MANTGSSDIPRCAWLAHMSNHSVFEANAALQAYAGKSRFGVPGGGVVPDT
jgi:hypothetical protein